MMVMTIFHNEVNDDDYDADDVNMADHLEELHQPGLVVHCANLLAQHAVEDLEKANYSNLEDPPLDKITLDMGKESGAVMSMKNLVSKIVRAPTANPCREQIAWASWSKNTYFDGDEDDAFVMLTCGMISPKTTMPRVAPMTATRPPPPVSASSRIVNVLFTFE